MSTFRLRAFTVLCLLWLGAVTQVGCGSGDDDTGGGGNVGNAGSKAVAGSGGSSGGNGGSSDSKGACKESPLFTPRKFGDDGRWVIGEVLPDSKSGDVYFSTGAELYVLPKGDSEPKLISERPQDIWSSFWLIDDGFLLPSGFQVPLVDTEIAVLYKMPRDGGDPTVQVAAPISNDDGWVYHIQDVAVVGDNVYWVAEDSFTAEPWRTPPEYDDTYYLRTTNWKNPGEPVELYKAKHELSGLLIAGGKAYLDEDLTDDIGSDSVQRIIALDGSGAEAMTAQDKYGGEIVAADDDSLIYTNNDTDDFASFGSYRIAPDGSGKEKLDDIYLISFGGTPAAHRDGTWVFMKADGIDHETLMEYQVGKGLKEIGCTTAGYQGGLVIGDGEALLAIKHDENNESTVLHFPL